MKKVFLLYHLFIFITLGCFAQTSYDIIGNGQGKGGAYLVKVTTKVKDVKTAKDELKRCAVHGVMFRGFTSEKEQEIAQKPIVSDPNVEKTKAEFFNAFWGEKGYERYVSITETSFTSAKVKKGYEVSALLLVKKEDLQHYLEESGIIKGFSNLW